MKAKTEWTPQQAITLYLTIEALLNQFDRENIAKLCHPQATTPNESTPNTEP